MTPPSPITDVCAHGVWREAALPFGHGTPLSTLWESSARGCEACTMLLRATEELYPDWTSYATENKAIDFWEDPRQYQVSYYRSLETEPFAVTLKDSENEAQDLEHGGSFQLLCKTAG